MAHEIPMPYQCALDWLFTNEDMSWLRPVGDTDIMPCISAELVAAMYDRDIQTVVTDLIARGGRKLVHPAAIEDIDEP